MARENRRNFKYYIAELTILVLGISLSFVLNEFRQERQERKIEGELLNQFRDNLILDSLMLSAQVQSLDLRMKASRYLLALDDKSEYKDSVGLSLIYLMNYGGFYASDITYQEMRSLGNSRLIQNKELLNEIIQLYEMDYDLVAEWASADRSFLMDELLPYANRNLPFARMLNFSLISNAKKRELMRVLQEDETKYLIQYSEIMKMGNKGVFEHALNEVRRVIGIINEELGDESKLLDGAETEEP